MYPQLKEMNGVIEQQKKKYKESSNHRNSLWSIFSIPFEGRLKGVGVLREQSTDSPLRAPYQHQAVVVDDHLKREIYDLKREIERLKTEKKACEIQ